MTDRQLVGFAMTAPIMNGACLRSKNLDDVKNLAASSVGAIVVGSITIKPRKQNLGKVYFKHSEGHFTLNSYGLPNGGLGYYQRHLHEMVDIAHEQSKLLIANVIGFSEAEFCQLIKLAETNGADMVELNFGCPNVWDDGSQKRIISYHASLVRSMLSAIKTARPRIKLAVKISPLPPDILAEVANAIVESEIIPVVTATNTFPNAAAFAGGGSVVDSGDGLAGLSGPALKPISLGVVKQLRELLPKDITIIGAGGVTEFIDLQDYLEAGAAAVQVASAFMEEGTPVFDRILSTVN